MSDVNTCGLLPVDLEIIWKSAKKDTTTNAKHVQNTDKMHKAAIVGSFYFLLRIKTLIGTKDSDIWAQSDPESEPERNAGSP